jgi:hypothetical protein
MLGLELPELEPPTAASTGQGRTRHSRTHSWGTEDVPEAVWEKMAAVVEASGRGRESEDIPGLVTPPTSTVTMSSNKTNCSP